jgi:hypothetical protein
MARSLETDLAHDAGLLRNTKRSSERSLLVRCLTRRCDAGDHQKSDYTREQRYPASLLQGITSNVVGAQYGVKVAVRLPQSR